MQHKILKIFVVLHIVIISNTFGQQVADTTFNPEIKSVRYPKGTGPVVYIDEGHHNFHTRTGRYRTFATLLERDGYRVKSYIGKFNADSLLSCQILVISNALNEINEEDWWLPTPSAFSGSEIEVVQQWVSEGGSLLLIADHMPMAGAAQSLAAVFGFEFTNGFVMHDSTGGTAFFSHSDSTLADCPITLGSGKDEAIENVVTFTGQGFHVPPAAKSFLTFNYRYNNLLPDSAWVFDDNTKKESAAGLSQGAMMEYGKGKVVMYGEAAMMTAQLAGPQQRKVGMNSPIAKDNYKLVLNTMHWLDSPGYNSK